ncbi:MAG: PhzF family phenazine biosynthesis protein [Robiginitomaculum sp.]|nr:PhzF family phenazine biosynthesis protein [Robiginitomaculum sp.]
MTIYPLYQIDAFASEIFSGNPAAVMPLSASLPDKVMQNIAQENNLAETAFIVQRADGDYDLRWFTPNAEIEFCGHATIASAHVLIAELGHSPMVVFHTQIGKLDVTHTKLGYTLKAPLYQSSSIPIDKVINKVFGKNIVGVYHARNNIYVELVSAQAVKDFTPDMGAIADYLASLSKDMFMGVSIMAEGNGDFRQYDFISRHFAPLHGVPEDPVTGSAHSALAPFWAKRLNGKTELLAYQCSKRGGELVLSVGTDAVYITGQAITYLRGEIFLTP